MTTSTGFSILPPPLIFRIRPDSWTATSRRRRTSPRCRSAPSTPSPALPAPGPHSTPQCRPASGIHYIGQEGLSAGFLISAQDLQHGVTLPGPQIADEQAAPLLQLLQRGDMAPGQVHHMDIVPAPRCRPAWDSRRRTHGASPASLLPPGRYRGPDCWGCRWGPPRSARSRGP